MENLVFKQFADAKQKKYKYFSRRNPFVVTSVFTLICKSEI
jgi:hypothetical protein